MEQATASRIAIVTPGTFVVPSGRSSSVELVALKVGEQLKAHVPVYLFGRQSTTRPAKETDEGMTYIRPPYRDYIRHTRRHLRRLKPSVIQVENRPVYAAYLKKRFPRTPVLLSLHSTTYVSKPHIGRKRLRACLRNVDAVIVNSHFLMEQMLKKDPGLTSKIFVNHLGVDPSRFASRWSEERQALRQEVLESLGWAGKKMIVFVGRLIPIKGVHHLLRAMPSVLKREPDARLLIIGGASYGSNRMTPYVSKLRGLARPIRSYVKFIPYVPHPEIPKWFQLGDVVTVPSSRREAFGLVNVEAMASGVPVVASRAGGMREIIDHGVTGLLVNPKHIVRELADSITALLGDPSYARSLGEQARVRVLEQFTWAHTARRQLELYHNMMQGPAGLNGPL